jgi:F0F1-type ATP synthase membrane subunit c/vacuolar-type H+-ATPase subunit K
VAAEPGPPVETTLRTSRIIHAALVGSLLLYAVVVHVSRATGAVRPVMDEPTLGGLRLAFYVLAGALALAVLVLRSRWLTADAAAGTPALLQTRLITCLALAEAIGVHGLVLFLLGGTLRDFYVFLIPALGLQLLLAPTREVWEAAARRAGPRSA